MIDNCVKRGKTNTTSDAWKVCEKQLSDTTWVKCKKQVIAESVVAESVVAEPVIAEPVVAEDEETQLLLLNETLQKQSDAIQKEKDIVVQRLKRLQTKREIEKIDAEIQMLQEKRQMLLLDCTDCCESETKDSEIIVSETKDNLKSYLLPYVDRVLDKLLETKKYRDLSKFLAPVAELFVLDHLKQNGFDVRESTSIGGLDASHDLEIVKSDGTTVKVQVKGRADKNWGFMTGKKPYNVSDFDLLAYLHYDKMGDLGSAKLWYFPATALMSTDTTMKTKIPVKVLEKYCNKEAQKDLLSLYF